MPDRDACGRENRRSGPARPVDEPAGSRRPRLPPWLKVRLPAGAGYRQVRGLVRRLGLHTVCQEAQCPNVGECWDARTLSLMILGDTCTRSCGFCDVKTGRPGAVDPDEPRRVAEAVAELKLAHVVITSVDRDELPDLGAGAWAETVRRLREACPDTTIEVLVPDFQARLELVDLVLDAEPQVFGHNLETIPRLYETVRPQARHEWSLAVLRRVAERGAVAKTGIMLGLGETDDEVVELMREAAEAGVSILTLGQYLRPSRRHLAVQRFVPPEGFEELAERGRALGLRHVEAGPLVRSSYHADQQARALAGDR